MTASLRDDIPHATKQISGQGHVQSPCRQNTETGETTRAVMTRSTDAWLCAFAVMALSLVAHRLCTCLALLTILFATPRRFAMAVAGFQRHVLAWGPRPCSFLSLLALISRLLKTRGPRPRKWLPFNPAFQRRLSVGPHHPGHPWPDWIRPAGTLPKTSARLTFLCFNCVVAGEEPDDEKRTFAAVSRQQKSARFPGPAFF